MEVKRDCPDIGRIFCGKAYIPNAALIDLVDCHIEADIVGCGITDIFHNEVVGVASDFVMLRPGAVQAQEDQVGFRQAERESAVGNDVDD